MSTGPLDTPVTGEDPPFRAMSSRAGQLITTGGITPYTTEGRLVETLGDVSPDALQAQTGAMLIDVPTERALAQVWRVYERLIETLAEHDATLEDILRQRVFLRDRRDLAVVERVLEVLLPSDWPPTTVIEMRAEGLSRYVDIQVDVIGLSPDGPLEKKVIPGESLSGRDGYVRATRAGQLVFTGNIIGINSATGELATRVAEIGKDHEALKHFRYGTDREEAILAQSWFIFRALEELLATQGGTLKDVLKVNGWLAFSMRDYGPLITARQHYFREGLPASTGLSIGEVVPDGAQLVYDAVALVPGDEGIEKEQLPASIIGTFYTDGVAAGPYVFTCGEVPIDTAQKGVVTSADELPDGAGQALDDGQIQVNSGLRARARYTYLRLQSHLEAMGATLADVAQQTVYLQRVSDYPAFEQVARDVFGTTPVPPTTLIPITDTSPYPEAEMEIDMIAYRAD